MFYFFLNNKLRGQLSFILLLTAVFAAMFFSKEIIVYNSQADGPLFILISKLLNGNTLTIKIVSFFILTGSGILLNELFKVFGFLPRKNYTFFLIWLILIIAFPLLWQINALMLSAVIFIYIFLLLFKAATENLETKDLISISLLFSLTSLIYKPLIFSVLFIPFALIILRQLNVKTLLASIVSFSLPYLWLWAYVFVTDKNTSIENYIILNGLDNHWSLAIIKNYRFLIPLLFTAVLFLFSFGKIATSINGKLIQIRIIYSLLIFYLLFILIIIFISPADNAHGLFLTFLPVSAITATGLLDTKKPLITDIYLGLFVLLSVFIFYF